MKLLRKKEIKKKFKRFKREKEIYIILENIQYARNVASMFRTSDAAQVKRMYLSGITKKPPFGKELKKVSRNKEYSVEWQETDNTEIAIKNIRNEGFIIIAVDITYDAVFTHELKKQLKDEQKVCFIFGSEVHGITKDTLALCDFSVAVPMYGRGASLNVGVSFGIVLYSF